MIYKDMGKLSSKTRVILEKPYRNQLNSGLAGSTEQSNGGKPVYFKFAGQWLSGSFGYYYETGVADKGK